MSNLITEISAGASGAAAIGTLLLACATFSMSKHARKSAKEAETANKQTQEVIKQNEQHHMDDSRPILMIYSSSGKDLEELENRAAMIQCPDNPKSSQNKISLIIDGNIKNIGKGIATNIKINIKFLKNERMLLIQDYQPIEPGESVIIGGSDFRSHQKEHSDFVDENNNFKKSFYNRARSKMKCNTSGRRQTEVRDGQKIQAIVARSAKPDTAWIESGAEYSWHCQAVGPKP